MVRCPADMHLSLYAHPFDLDALQAHGGLARLRDLGFDAIALAVSYHAGRWLMPWHPAGMVRFLEDGVVHYRPSGDYGSLRPLPSSAVPADGPSPLQRLCSDAPKAGIEPRAWVVGTHNSRLGRLHPDCCVENAFGDRYSYALCPANPAVQQYLLAMVRDLAGHAGLGTLELEAFGWMGWKHSSHHEKASFTPDAEVDALLSLCFCPHCMSGAAGSSGGPVPGRAAVVAQLRARIEHGCAMDAKAGGAIVFDANSLRPFAQHRHRIVTTLLQRVIDATPAHRRALHVTAAPSPMGGSQVPIAAGEALRVGDELVLTAYGMDVGAIERSLRAVAKDGPDAGVRRERPLRVSIWPKAPQFTSDDDLRRLRAIFTEHGVAAVGIYHLGLLPWRTLERVARTLSA